MSRKRTKENLIVVDDETKIKLKIKKWYCIIQGFNYGLLGIFTSFVVVGFMLCLLILHYCFKYIPCFKCLRDMNLKSY